MDKNKTLKPTWISHGFYCKHMSSKTGERNIYHVVCVCKANYDAVILPPLAAVSFLQILVRHPL
jgi:hypothetical protein